MKLCLTVVATLRLLLSSRGRVNIAMTGVIYQLISKHILLFPVIKKEEIIGSLCKVFSSDTKIQCASCFENKGRIEGLFF